MDSFNILNLKFEKSNAIKKHRRLQQFTTLFRFIEFSFLLVMISRFSVQLPSAFKLPGEIFRHVSSTLFSPRFVFLIGNVIVITLFLKSGWLTTQYNSIGNKATEDFCAEYVENSVKGTTTMVDTCDYMERKIHRSQSENLNRAGGEKQSRQLRRSATERCLKTSPAVSSHLAEEMSGEEFRRTVEDFIARQQRFLREEEFPAM